MKKIENTSIDQVNKVSLPIFLKSIANYKKNLFKAGMILLLCLSQISCKKFVEIDVPQNQLVTSSVFNNSETAVAALTAVYSQMMDKEFMPYMISLYCGLAADELTNYSTETNLRVYTNSLTAADAPTNKIWTLGYSFIYQANSVFEGCGSSENLLPAIKKQLMAEALFIRAYWTFYLVNLFGEVPLITSTNYINNAIAPRADIEMIYSQIVEDLLYAQENLNEEYVDGNSISNTTDRIRPNKYAAKALLSRVYLYHSEYNKAEQFATEVINNKAKYDTVGINTIFLKNSKEAIWQLMKPTPTQGINTWEGAYFILTSRPMSNFQNSSTISDRLYESFETGDLRKDLWIGKYTDTDQTPSVDYFFPNKYKVDNSGNVTEYSMLLRLAEQYLIRSEARAKQGNLNGAIEDVDVIRNRAHLPLIKDVNPAIDEDELLKAILKERQAELFTEWGHRWLDLKRTGKINDIMSAEAPIKGGSWDDWRQLWPIPQQELLNNSKLVQNFGYN